MTLRILQDFSDVACKPLTKLIETEVCVGGLSDCEELVGIDQ